MKPTAVRIAATLLLLITAGVFARVSTTLAGAPVAHKSSTQSIAPGSGQPSATYRGVLPVAQFDVSPPLHSMKATAGPGAIKENEDIVFFPNLPGGFAGPQEQDTVVQKILGPLLIPTPIISFNGPPNISNVAPPDPNGEVGPNHIVVMDNLQFQVFNKTGTSLLGPSNNNTLWAGFGGPCQVENAGDPVVIYDQLADRWLLSQFTSAGPTYFNCVALSTTADPTGTYFRWAFTTGTNFPDYPKYGMMPVPNAYFISTREFAGGVSFAGVGAYAANRAQMIAGNPGPQVISFLATPGAQPYRVGDGLLPADMDGTTSPPSGSDEYFIGSQDNNGPYGSPSDALNLWKFHVDFATPANSTFTLVNTIATAPFNSILALCGGTRNCIPQPGTATRIDHLGYRQRPLFRLAYRNIGGVETLLTNQSVSAGAGPSGEVSGIRWWEVRSPAASPFIHQEGTYAPGLTDGIHRWMGSIAMNGTGSIGLAYSASSSTVFPSVRYTGRVQTDPLGQMPQGEASIIDGTGSQTAGGSRWGDYTDTTVDPTDDCTFWHVNQYIPTTSANGWRLRIGAFRFGTCSGATPTPTSTSTRTATRTSTRTPTNPPTSTNTPLPTSTSTSTATRTSTRTPTSPPTGTSTATGTPTRTPTRTPTAPATGVLVGHVNWEGRPAQPSALQALPITLTLRLGASTTNYPGLTTDPSGFFTVPVGALPNGTYTWRVKGPHGSAGTNTTPGFLANSGTVGLTGAPSTSQEMGLLRAGDANNDNVVEVLDFNALKNSFGKTPADPGYDPTTDFNGDNTVEILDFNLLTGNFGQSGADRPER